MDKSLKLKHLCGYLPYDVYAERDGDITRIMPYHLGMRLKQIERGQIFKLCLLPLSALTEPEYQSMLDEFSEIESFDLLERIDYAKMSLISSEDVCNNLRFEVIKVLFKNHFDIFDLIGSGLAIDKRTVKL